MISHHSAVIEVDDVEIVLDRPLTDEEFAILSKKAGDSFADAHVRELGITSIRRDEADPRRLHAHLSVPMTIHYRTAVDTADDGAASDPVPETK